MAENDSKGPGDGVRAKARVLLLPNFGAPPVVQLKRRGRLPYAITRLSDYSWAKRVRELDNAKRQEAISKIEMNQRIVAKYREELQLSTFQLAHKKRLNLKSLIGIHTEWIEESKAQLQLGE